MTLSSRKDIPMPSNLGYQSSGAVLGATPAVPASGVATFPVDRDCIVYISGGTITAIAIGAPGAQVTTGLTVAPGPPATSVTVIVQAQKTIVLTYTGSPSWTWIPL